MNQINVLNGGYVRLVDHMGSDLAIVRSARVSYDAEWREVVEGEIDSKDEKLINYLMKNKHTSPFESVVFQFEVKAPIFVFRQWHRHRTWSYNEVSARYTQLPEEFYVPEPDKLGAQSSSNKQGRTNEPVADASALVQLMKDQNARTFWYYKHLLDCGVTRELARSVLPVSTYSHMFAKVNLLNLFKFLTLRLNPHAQYEIRVYAEAMLELIRPVVPVAVAAWEAV